MVDSARVVVGNRLALRLPLRLLHVDSQPGAFTERYWWLWTSKTGGAFTTLGDDRSLSEVIIELLGLIP